VTGRQIDFPPEQRHSKRTELILLAICAVCIVFVIICIETVGGGGIPQ
jgi:hypothetical protein